MAMNYTANQVLKNLDDARDAMHSLYKELCETNPIAALYVLEQMNAANETRNKMANVVGLL